MDDKQQNNVPKKGDYILNPSTQRMVKVGSRVWLELVKKGLVSGHYRDPKELATVPDEYHEEDVEKKINAINKTLPRGKQAVRGRGKYKGKIVSRNTQPSASEISRYTAQIASRAVNNHIDELAECGDDDDLEGMLEKLILEEMMSTRPATAPPVVRKRTVGRPNVVKSHYQYQVAEAPANDYDYDEFDDEEDLVLQDRYE